jgi:arsenate reductase (thioredoxin)
MFPTMVHLPLIESPFYSPLQHYITSVVQEYKLIPDERKEVLRKLVSYIQSGLQTQLPVRLLFICTHNSRRSHLSQLWAQTAASYFGIPGLETYSGGTEVTAFNVRAVNALRKAGFSIEETGDKSNPVYEVKFRKDMAPLKLYSKTYDAAGNPKEHFAAIMTCSQADEACPFISGAGARIAIAYEDPKQADETPREEAVYDERTRQIAREMLFVMSQVKQQGV